MIFLDNASTTKICDAAKKIMIEEADNYFNASASYSVALENKKKIDSAKKEICNCLNVDYKENLVFTASATEANNLAVFGSAKKSDEQYLFSSGEHLCIYNCAEELKNRGYNVKFIPLTSEGVIDFDALKQLLEYPTAFVSCIHVSNETGAINDVEKIGELVKSKWKNAIFHCDGVQAFGKIDVNLSRMKNIDLYTISAHKIGGPKGIGALFVRNKAKLKPYVFGGGQEFGLRSGTENLQSILAFAAASTEKFKNLQKNYDFVSKLCETFKNEIKKYNDNRITINSVNASPYIVSISFAGVKGETLVRMCDDDGLLVGTGSACSSKKAALNRILLAMNKNRQDIEGALRISFSINNTIDEIVSAVKILVDNYHRLISMLA